MPTRSGSRPRCGCCVTTAPGPRKHAWHHLRVETPKLVKMIDRSRASSTAKSVRLHYHGSRIERLIVAGDAPVMSPSPRLEREVDKEYARRILADAAVISTLRDPQRLL